MSKLRLSVLDVSPFPVCLDLAPRVEELGYERYWIAEHHGEGAASNPTLLVPLVAGTTTTIRVGTAGVLLRFQSALAVAEAFRLLSHAFPGRIDLGVGRSAAATSAQTTALLDGRPGAYSTAAHGEKVADLQQIVCGRVPTGHPLSGETIDPPLTAAGVPAFWVLSTSLEGAALAARLGARYSFHDAFNPGLGPRAVERYVAEFQPSPELAAPSWNVCVAGYCAKDAAGVRRGPDPVTERAAGRCVIAGTEDDWRDALGSIVRAYRTEEIVVQTLWHDHDVDHQVDSFERIARVAATL
jgi:luciferase family oxidoreductase group 1